MELLAHIHWSSQYLVAAAKSFLSGQPDDSHTNLGFDPERGWLSTHDLQGKGSLIYAIADKSLHWDYLDARVELQGTKHEGILRRLHLLFADSGFMQPYRYDLHYALPYPRPAEGFSFPEAPGDTLARHVAVRAYGHKVLKAITEAEGWLVEPRVWPHHFDTGLLISGLSGDGLALALGLAVPDHHCDTYYLYVSGYRGEQAIDPAGFPPLTGKARWVSEEFHGGVFPIEGAGPEEGIGFIREAMRMLRSK